MRQTTIRETHYITHDDWHDIAIPMMIDVTYKVLDDGYPVIEIDPDSIDYPTEGNA